jgi:rhodanese-related sulfurtransferase
LIGPTCQKSLDVPNRKGISMSGNDLPFTHPSALSLPDEITPHRLARTRPLPVIVDIREQRQFLSGHIAGAEHITRGELERNVTRIAPELTIPILVYCAVGNEASLAAEKLARIGYRNVSSLKGGLQGWLEAGGMVECSESDSLAGTR